ncbi:MAG: AAA family ATPase [Acidimicrobiia bacterium]|nr:AAA family ATPase [Acidimicrobiia bacterium]
MDERDTLLEAIESQEQLRGSVPDDVIDATIAALEERLVALEQVPTQRRQMTVLFADVSGFTAMSESMDAEDVSDIMDTVWRRLDAAIVEHNGTIDKHIGDAVMGLWGVGSAREDDPEQAIRAALAIQGALTQMAAEDPSLESLAVRVGINTGPVVIGEVGTAGEVTVTGDTVNVASRLESAAPVGGVLVSHSTYRHVRGVFNVTQRPPLEVKGKSEPLVTYIVETVAPRPFRLPTRGVEGVETAMVGREQQLAALQAAQQRSAADSASASVTIVGEAGIGKSRLLYEFNEWLSLAGSDVVVFRGRADQQHQGNPYGLLRDVLAFRFDIADDDPADVAVEKLTSGVTEFLGESAVDQAHLVGHLMGLDMSASPHIGHILDDARQLRDRAIHGVTQLFGAIADRVPTVVMLEDIHWADRATLVMGQKVIDACADKRLFVVAAARPLVFERVPEWGTGPRDVRLDLEPLDADAAAALTDEVLKRAADVPTELRDTIVARADGNPFFVEEIIKMLIEDDVIEAGDDEWVIRQERLEDFNVPATLTGVIQARLDRLDAAERDLLGRASVVGRLFWDLAIPPPVDAGAEPIGEVHRLLKVFEDRELVWPHPGADFVGTEEYIFRHAVLREVTYESVLKRLRRSYHRSIAEWLASRAEAPGRAAMIATHYEAAGAPAESAEWYVTAGEQAQARFANTSAETYFGKALEYGDLSAADRFRAADGLAEVAMLGARYDDAVSALRDAVAAAEETGSVGDQARALIGIAFAMLREGRSREASEVAADAEARLRAQADPDPGMLSEAIRGSASVLLRLGEITRPKRDARKRSSWHERHMTCERWGAAPDSSVPSATRSPTTTRRPNAMPKRSR